MLACVYLAKQDTVTPLQDIAEHERIPADFLEKILQELKRAGVVESKKGARGGYMLSRQAKDISAQDIIQTLEGSMTPFMCVSGKHTEASCPRLSSCQTKQVWQRLDESITATLRGITLQDLIQK